MTKKAIKKTGKDRKKEILCAAVELARGAPYWEITREELGLHLKIAPSLISFYFKRVEDLHKEVVKRAIEEEMLDIVCLAILRKDPYMMKSWGLLSQKLQATLKDIGGILEIGIACKK